MAIIPIQPVRRERQERRQKIDPIDRDMGRILAALQIANQGFGIAARFDEMDERELRMEAERKRQEKLDLELQVARPQAAAAQTEEEIRAARKIEEDKKKLELEEQKRLSEGAPTAEQMKESTALGIRKQRADVGAAELTRKIKQEEFNLLKNPDPRAAQLLDAQYKEALAKSEKAQIDRDRAAAEWASDKATIESTIKEAPNTVLGQKLAMIQGQGAEQKKRFDSVMLAAAGIKQMRLGLSKDDFVARPSIVGKNDFTLGRDMYTEGLGRMLSGGVISEDENDKFERFVPGISDMMFGDPKMQMEQAERVILQRAQTFGFTPEDVDAYLSQSRLLPSTEELLKQEQKEGQDPLQLEGSSRKEREALFEQYLGDQL